MKTARRVAATAVLGAAMLSATPASAEGENHSWTSALSGVAAHTWGTHAQINVYDGAADGNPVYAVYYRRNGVGAETLWNHLGFNEFAWSNYDEGHPITWMKGCVFHNSGREECGGILYSR